MLINAKKCQIFTFPNKKLAHDATIIIIVNLKEIISPISEKSWRRYVNLKKKVSYYTQVYRKKNFLFDWAQWEKQRQP